MGELVASIAHELNQPLATVVTHGSVRMRWLDREKPDLDRARQAVGHIERDAGHAGEVIRGLRALAKKSGPQLTQLEVNPAIQEVLALIGADLQRRGVSLRTALTRSHLRPLLHDQSPTVWAWACRSAGASSMSVAADFGRRLAYLAARCSDLLYAKGGLDAV